MLQFLTISDPVKIRAALIQVGRLVAVLESSKNPRDGTVHELQPVPGGASSSALYRE
jgi:hypothetical protein